METNKRAYRIVQNEGKITYRVEDLWEGGIKKGPYNSVEIARKDERRLHGIMGSSIT